MTDQEARAILKKHCAAYGDTKYEPARWVVEALQAAVAQEREACAKVCDDVASGCDSDSDDDGNYGRIAGDECARVIRARSNA